MNIKTDKQDRRTEVSRYRRILYLVVALLLAIAVTIASPARSRLFKFFNFDRDIETNADRMLSEGRQTFRADTFGDEAFWGGMLRLHAAIEGEQFGGVGPGLSPVAALGLGLKVDVDALPHGLVQQIKQGKVDLNDPAVTLALLRRDAVLGSRDSSTTVIV